MIAHELSAGPVRVELANAIREVNAAHAAAGGHESPQLKECWVRLDRTLSLAVIAGDDRAARMAVDGYRTSALAAIEAGR